MHFDSYSLVNQLVTVRIALNTILGAHNCIPVTRTNQNCQIWCFADFVIFGLKSRSKAVREIPAKGGPSTDFKNQNVRLNIFFTQMVEPIDLWFVLLPQVIHFLLPENV